MSNVIDQASFLLEENLKKALTEMLILHLLAQKESYIGELAEALRERSGGALTVVFPYAAIYRLQQAGHITESGKRIAPDGRRRQFFSVTDTGKAHLQQLLKTYRAFSAGVDAVLQRGEEPNEP